VIEKMIANMNLLGAVAKGILLRAGIAVHAFLDNNERRQV